MSKLAINDLNGSARLDRDALPLAELARIRGGVRWQQGSSSKYVIDLTAYSETGYALGIHFGKGSDGMWRALG